MFGRWGALVGAGGVNCRKSASVLLPLVLAGWVSTAGAEADPMAWLTRADEAVGHSNFTGTMILYENGSERVMRIQQGFDGEQVQQRLVALSGEECEILRRQDESSVVFPDRRLVIYGYQRTESPIPNILQDMEQMSKYYELEIQGQEQVAGRDCQQVVAESRDQYRYGCEFCVDMASGLPLRVRMRSPDGGRIERFAFTSLDVLESIQKFDPSSFQLETDTHGFEMVDMLYGASPEPDKWRVGNMPPGFEERLAVVRRLPRNPEPVYHMVLADALSRISVFITPLAEGDSIKSRAFTRKTNNGYVTVRDGHRVTVIGAVPAKTIRMIGDSLNLQH